VTQPAVFEKILRIKKVFDRSRIKLYNQINIKGTMKEFVSHQRLIEKYTLFIIYLPLIFQIS
jgi:hypothetical protein